MIENIRSALKRIKTRVRTHPYICGLLRYLDEATLGRALARYADDKNLAVLILMPGSLHLGLLAEEYLARFKNVLLIQNGLSAQEVAIVERKGGRNKIRLRTMTLHDRIIDVLLHSLNEPFWIVDHDCYLFSDALFAESNEPQTEAGQAVFAFHNEGLNALIPETFLMRLNPRVLRNVSKRFSVTARVYTHEELPDKARYLLETAGWNSENYPEPHKKYYDTLRVLFLLCQSLGCGPRICPGYSTRCEIHREVVHIGNTSRPQWSIDPAFYNAIGAYFWKLSLLEQDDIRQLESYRIRALNLPSLDYMRDQLVHAGCCLELLSRLELVAKGL
jgi:hypothetical protein